MNWSREQADTVDRALRDLPKDRQIYALHYLWGVMMVRDLQACIDAVAYAGSPLAELLDEDSP